MPGKPCHRRGLPAFAPAKAPVLYGPQDQTQINLLSGDDMSVDQATVRRIAHLARIAVNDEDVPHLQNELNAILAFVEELNSVDVEGVEPMTSVVPMKMRWRRDAVADQAGAAAVVVNAPVHEDQFFTVPKVVE
jgi:aspartyl-tRNA(Asn)/glutamyl-tRNA(Gln) amidotransferase subunit C